MSAHSVQPFGELQLHIYIYIIKEVFNMPHDLILLYYIYDRYILAELYLKKI